MNAPRSKSSSLARTIVVTALVTIMLAGPMALAFPEQAGAAEGISMQAMASATNIEEGGQLVVTRMVIEPGIGVAAHRHPGPASFVVISGSLQTTLLRGGASVNRFGAEHVAEIGDTMNLSPGVVISYAPDAVKTMANRGHSPLVLMVTMVLNHGEPMTAFEDSSGILQFGRR